MVKEPLIKKPLIKPPIVKPVVPCPGGDDDSDDSSCTPGSKLRNAASGGVPLLGKKVSAGLGKAGPPLDKPLLKKPLVKPPIVKPVVPCPGGDDDDDESSCTSGSKLRKAIPPAVKPRVIKDALVKPVRTPVFEVMPPPR